MNEFFCYSPDYHHTGTVVSPELRYDSVLGLRFAGIAWQIKYDSGTPSFPISIRDDVHYQQVRSEIEQRHNHSSESNGQDERHILTAILFQKHWEQITGLFSDLSSRTYTPFCLPEVALRNGKNALPDIMGIGSTGFIATVEISSKSRSNDARQQAKIASHVLGGVPVTGIAARYKFAPRGDTANVYLYVA